MFLKYHVQNIRESLKVAVFKGKSLYRLFFIIVVSTRFVEGSFLSAAEKINKT